jgi:hypothetical protein
VLKAPDPQPALTEQFLLAMSNVGRQPRRVYSRLNFRRFRRIAKVDCLVLISPPWLDSEADLASACREEAVLDEPAIGSKTTACDCGQKGLGKKIERRRPGIVRSACDRDRRRFVRQEQGGQNRLDDQ